MSLRGGRASHLTLTMTGLHVAAAEALIGAVCLSSGGRNGWSDIQQEIVHGRCLDPEVVQIRDEICWLLHENGYADAEIAVLVNRGRSSISGARARHRARIEADSALRARMAFVIGESEGVGA